MRRLFHLKGADVIAFLHGMVTNDVRPLARADGVVYTALLTPQGKYLADFFVLRDRGEFYLDLPEVIAEDTVKRLSFYRLRADVRFEPADLAVYCGTGTPPPPGAYPDPRHAAMGWRLYGGAAGDDGTDFTTIRIQNLIPETGYELIANDSYILEHHFESLHGVDFRKGCYVGQEVTARMKHKTELRKGLFRVTLGKEVPYGTPICRGDKEIGRVLSVRDQIALAYLRRDLAEGDLTAGDTLVRLVPDGPEHADQL